MSTPAADRPTQSPEQAHGSRVGDLRIRRDRRTRLSLLDRIATRVRGALAR